LLMPCGRSITRPRPRLLASFGILPTCPGHGPHPGGAALVQRIRNRRVSSTKQAYAWRRLGPVPICSTIVSTRLVEVVWRKKKLILPSNVSAGRGKGSRPTGNGKQSAVASSVNAAPLIACRALPERLQRLANSPTACQIKATSDGRRKLSEGPGRGFMEATSVRAIE
jgi:hypothetical protein